MVAILDSLLTVKKDYSSYTKVVFVALVEHNIPLFLGSKARRECTENGRGSRVPVRIQVVLCL